MDKTLHATCRKVSIEDPNFPSPAAVQVFFTGSRQEQDRALSKLNRKIIAGKIKEVAFWGASMGAFGAVAGLAGTPSPELFVACISAAVVGGAASLAAIANIAGSESEGSWDQATRTRHAAAAMLGEPVSANMAEKLHARLKNR